MRKRLQIALYVSNVFYHLYQKPLKLLNNYLINCIHVIRSWNYFSEINVIEWVIVAV